MLFVWIVRCDVVCFVSESACREQWLESSFWSRDAGGAARQADGTAEAESFVYGLRRLVF